MSAVTFVTSLDHSMSNSAMDFGVSAEKTRGLIWIHLEDVAEALSPPGANGTRQTLEDEL